MTYNKGRKGILPKNINKYDLFVQGALATAATFCLIYWVIAIKGPAYPAMFNPLALIFVAISEAILLGEPIRLGMYEHSSFIINLMPFTIFPEPLAPLHWQQEKHVLYHATRKIINIKSKCVCSLLGMVLILMGLYSFL